MTISLAAGHSVQGGVHNGIIMRWKKPRQANDSWLCPSNPSPTPPNSPAVVSLLSQTLYTLHPTMLKRYKISSPFKLIDTQQPLLLLINCCCHHSGIARFAAGRRVGANLRTARLSNAFKATTPALPVLGARYMATEATRVGKIHQVIGAVVDVVRSEKKSTPFFKKNTKLSPVWAAARFVGRLVGWLVWLVVGWLGQRGLTTGWFF